MKVTFNIDCTPEEARRFLGLPDLTSVHDVYLQKMTALVSDGVTPAVVTEMMRGWSPMGEAGTQMFKTMMDQMTGAARSK